MANILHPWAPQQYQVFPQKPGAAPAAAENKYDDFFSDIKSP